MWLPRTITKKVLNEILNPVGKKITIIYGARQVGKTTLLKQILEDYSGKAAFYNCDHFDVQNTFAHKNTGSLRKVSSSSDCLP